MKLGTVRLDTGHTALASVTGEGVGIYRNADGAPAFADVGELLRSPGGLAELDLLSPTMTPWSSNETPWDVPVVRPDHILCVAANYREHIEETGTITYASKSESAPWFFSKPNSSLNPHNSPIRIPNTYGEKIDWEAELGVVIGRGGSNIDPGGVANHIAGYTVINDISARGMNVPERTKLRDRDSFHDWLHGKWFDTFCCVGPWMVTADEIADPTNLAIGLTLNGEVWQDGSTAQMIFPIPELIAFISSIVSLRPGDLIATGTPSGVGKSKGRFLAPGEVVVATVDGVGELTNPIVGPA